MNNKLFILLEVVIALLIVIILNKIAVKIMTNDEIIEDPTRKMKTVLFNGWVETNGFTNKKFNTFNQFATNYRKLPHSMNKLGGAQFTYTMWIKLNNTSAENVANKVLFLQGDPSLYNFTETIGNTTKTINDFLVKCPVVKFGNGVDEINVEFNTTKEISARASILRVPNADETIRHNMVSLLPGKWAMLTFVFEDDKRYNEFEDGVIFRFYVNDIMYNTSRFTGALRLNQGDLNILPNGGILDGYLADLTYYNYAFNVEDVRNVFAKGFNNNRYNEMDNDPSFNEPLYLTQYNKLEINNL